MQIAPISRQTVSDQVFEQLKQNLVNGVWKPGEKIPSENELCALFGISRITVRQALGKLSALGMIETRLGEGSYARNISGGTLLQEILPLIYSSQVSPEQMQAEVIEFRKIYEVNAAALAAQRITDAELEDLRHALAQMHSNRDDLPRYAEADLEFHSLLAEATRNSLIIQINSIISDVLRLSISGTTSGIGTENGLFYHQKLVDACARHDTDAASLAMRKHLDLESPEATT